MIKNCAICGQEFETQYEHKKYCSKACYTQSKRLQAKAWVRAHSEKVKAARKAYYEANREICLANATAWRKAHPEKIKEYRRNYKETRHEQIRTRKKAACLHLKPAEVITPQKDKPPKDATVEELLAWIFNEG